MRTFVQNVAPGGEGEEPLILPTYNFSRRDGQDGQNGPGGQNDQNDPNGGPPGGN